jgi:glucose-1-phosphate cytidylyltransferase
MTDTPTPVVILCGGQGRRLGHSTELRPKPLLEVGDRPIVRHVMDIYARHGYRRFVLCLGYKGAMIEEYFRDRPPPSDWQVELVHTGEEAMTGARIKRIAHLVDTPEIFLTYADGVCDLDLARLMTFHRSHGSIATVTAVRPPERFGVLALEGTKVTQFVEKPPAVSYINGGFFVLGRDFFDYLSDNDGCVLERDPLERAAREGQLHAFCHDGFWQCLDTAKDLDLLNALWDSGEAPWIRHGIGPDRCG